MSFTAAPIYERYRVSCRSRWRIAGGIPRDERAIEFIMSRMSPEAAANFRRQLADAEKAAEKGKEIDAATLETATAKDIALEQVSRITQGFPWDDTGLYLGGYQVKAMLKEVFDVLGLGKANRGLKSRVWNGVFVEEDRIHLHNAKGPLSTPSGVAFVTGHVFSAQGPRTIIRLNEYAEDVEFAFSLRVFDGAGNPAVPTLKRSQLETMLTLAQDSGIGSMRSLGYGKFDVLNLEEASPQT